MSAWLGTKLQAKQLVKAAARHLCLTSEPAAPKWLRERGVPFESRLQRRQPVSLRVRDANPQLAVAPSTHRTIIFYF